MPSECEVFSGGLRELSRITHQLGKCDLEPKSGFPVTTGSRPVVQNNEGSEITKSKLTEVLIYDEIGEIFIPYTYFNTSLFSLSSSSTGTILMTFLNSSMSIRLEGFLYGKICALTCTLAKELFPGLGLYSRIFAAMYLDGNLPFLHYLSSICSIYCFLQVC